MVPLVTVICTCYNQEAYIQSALDSVLAQKGVEVELFVIDNGSRDGSSAEIEKWLAKHPSFPPKLIFRKESINYCKSFNEALRECRGDYLVDLSGDDRLLDGHLSKSIQKLELHPTAAVSFSDALLVKGDTRYRFYDQNRFGPPIKEFGDVYLHVIHQYCISTVTMVFRTEMLKNIGGYDEELVYEDFDVLCRLARLHPFVFSDHVGVEKTLHANAYSQQQYRFRNSEMLWSTLKVCHKIHTMNQNDLENRNLKRRALHEAKHALLSANFKVGWEFFKLAF
ncbi:glycosyltransferase [Litoribacter alkaliphilus]|uniref:Glycosyltransferase n=1 Tax=Litoribacter ruber TaxID=702568 RepID=A0AAP2CEH0_9BACT|nr:glycosyltransferase [Litoribacter alkaliphilus]MBS9522946.1 glycosyltransferase [Litoribacter alkaliphilus]